MSQNVIAVFIDGDNVSPKHTHLILREIQAQGRVLVRRVYCDFSCPNAHNWLVKAQENGTSCIQCDRVSKKNSSDIKLCCDLMKTLYTNDLINLFYIVTTDSDFRHVIPYIRETGKAIHVIGSEQTHVSLQRGCDRFTKIEILCNEAPKEVSKPKRTRSHSKEDIWEIPPASVLQEESVPKKVSDLRDVLDDVLDLLGDSEMHLSMLKSMLLLRHNAFDQREYGCRHFKKFLRTHLGDKLDFDTKNDSVKLKEHISSPRRANHKPPYIILAYIVNMVGSGEVEIFALYYSLLERHEEFDVQDYGVKNWEAFLTKYLGTKIEHIVRGKQMCIKMRD